MKYSRFIFPLQIILDIVLLCFLWSVTVVFFERELVVQDVLGSLFSWFISIYVLGNYRLMRFSRIPNIIQNLSKLTFVFMSVNLMLQRTVWVSHINAWIFFVFHVTFFVSISFFRVVTIKLIRRYRSLGKNYRNVVVLGDSQEIKRFENLFKDGNEFGYRLKKTFRNRESYLSDFINFAVEGKIDEVFVSSELFNSSEFNKLVDFTDNNFIKTRVVPSLSGYVNTNLKLDYIGFQPILVHGEIPLDDPVDYALKRTFDIVFSLFIILGVLSWLIPLMGIIIKRESKGPLFFKQKRSGINNEDFYCYKFRSMAVNQNANLQQATKQDARVTKVGAFIRRTSIDELPQFINVFLGDMSVVGPRPHMVKHTLEFSSIIDRYMLRHYVKPGITGLAQVTGYRGETNTIYELKGRVTLDRFYIENWSFFLDMKIIYKTVVNVLLGEDGAY